MKKISPSAGADKKAEAGAGAATEFQFVSTAAIFCTLTLSTLFFSDFPSSVSLVVFQTRAYFCLLFGQMRYAVCCKTMLYKTIVCFKVRFYTGFI